ncbi:DNA-binding MarR family transcriptional regulator [Kribbella voronezhensis]|uniref:DNA-binding MarR family transcriptional regulator n=1 Tax=Kribbella voronezhensis TaxID=2512212 RepID=A0A4R7SVK3_9ACTN|nr:MarR family transcriptional regulator [Kribbella voronezhensis]TDU83342.1 DNA-binding MarR family transcriptional regulator [Kribbella voronezhensis]
MTHAKVSPDGSADTSAGSDRAGDAAAVEEASLALVELTLRALSASGQLSVLQVRVLLVIQQHGPLKLGDVARLLDMSLPSASRLVTRLADDGLLLRSTPSHDRRQVQLVVSAKGRKLLNRLRANRLRGITDVLAAMPPADRTALIRGMASFAKAADDSQQPAPD